MDSDYHKNLTSHLITSCFAPLHKNTMEQQFNETVASPKSDSSNDKQRLRTKITILVMGKAMSGKSSLINKMIFGSFVDKHEETFQDEYSHTVTTSIRTPEHMVHEFMYRYMDIRTLSKSWRKHAGASHRTFSCDANASSFGDLDQLQRQIMEYDSLHDEEEKDKVSDALSTSELSTNLDLPNSEKQQTTEVIPVDVEVRIIDTSGNENVQTGVMKDEYYGAIEESDGYMMVFDVSNMESLSQLQSHFYQQILFLSDSAKDNYLKSFHLVANKCDLEAESESERQNVISNAEEFSRDFFIGGHPLDQTGIPFYQTSAKSVNKEQYLSPERLFKAIVTHAVERKLQRKLIQILQGSGRRNSVLFGKYDSNIYDKYNRLSQRMSTSSRESNRRNTMQQNTIRSMAKMVRESGLSLDEFQNRHSMKIPDRKSVV